MQPVYDRWRRERLERSDEAYQNALAAVDGCDLASEQIVSAQPIIEYEEMVGIELQLATRSVSFKASWCCQGDFQIESSEYTT